MNTHTFKVPMEADPDELPEKFSSFLGSLHFNDDEDRSLNDMFRREVLPNLKRTLALRSGGSNIRLSKRLETSKGEIVVEFDTTSRGIFAKLRSAFGM